VLNDGLFLSFSSWEFVYSCIYSFILHIN